MQDNFNIILGKKIREIRKAQSISLNKLAQAMNVSYQQLQKYETGTNRISAEKLFEVAQFLNVEAHQFFPDHIMRPDIFAHSKLPSSFSQIKNEETKQLLIELIEKLAKA